MSDDYAKLEQGAGSARIEVVPYHSGRGEKRCDDIRISRPAGIVSAREDNARGTDIFRGTECLSRNHGR